MVLHGPNPKVDIRLSEVNRHQLRMAVGHMQERDLTKCRHVVQTVSGLASTGLRTGAHAHAGHGACAHDLNEFALTQVH